MKNTFLLVCLLLSLSASAQNYLGVKGGMNLANFNGFTSIMDPRIGFHGGIYAGKQLIGKFTLQAEALYSQKGSRQDVLVPISQTDMQWMRFRTNYTYIDVPIIVKYQLFKRFTPYAGPQVSILAGKNARIKGLENQHSTISGQGRVQLGLVAGLGYAITERIWADTRYSRELLGNGLQSHLLQVGLTYKVFSRQTNNK
jgi:opacity protein-like surface antigen